MATHRLDTARLHTAIAAKCVAEGLSARDVAEHTGISASTLTRIKQGQRPDADALVTLLAWLGAPLHLFATPHVPEPAQDAAYRRGWDECAAFVSESLEKAREKIPRPCRATPSG